MMKIRKNKNPNGIKKGDPVRTTKAFRKKTGKHFTGVVMEVLELRREHLATVKMDNSEGFGAGSMSAHWLKRRNVK